MLRRNQHTEALTALGLSLKQSRRQQLAVILAKLLCRPLPALLVMQSRGDENKLLLRVLSRLRAPFGTCMDSHAALAAR